MTTGSRIRAARIEASLTQKELAEKIGVSSPYIRLFELGKRKPSDKHIEDIAEALGVPKETLTDYKINSVKDMVEILNRLEEGGCTIKVEDGGRRVTIDVDPKGPHAPKFITAFKEWGAKDS